MTLNIRQERLNRGWTLVQAAGKVGMTKAAYGNLETGTRKPSYDILVKLLELYDYKDPRDLFGAATPANEGPSH